MVIGDFNKSVTVEKNTPTAKAGGGWADSWATLLSTRGCLRKKSGSRKLDVGQIYEDNSYDLWLRYETALETNMSAKTLRFQIDSKVYVIGSIEKVGERNFYYKFSVSQHG